MNKKWESPKLEQLSVKKTEHWKYMYQCTGTPENPYCEYFSSSTKFDDYLCHCGGTVKCIGKYFNDFGCCS